MTIKFPEQRDFVITAAEAKKLTDTQAIQLSVDHWMDHIRCLVEDMMSRRKPATIRDRAGQRLGHGAGHAICEKHYDDFADVRSAVYDETAPCKTCPIFLKGHRPCHTRGSVWWEVFSTSVFSLGTASFDVQVEAYIKMLNLLLSLLDEPHVTMDDLGIAIQPESGKPYFKRVVL